jgi:hypothetical protein
MPAAFCYRGLGWVALGLSTLAIGVGGCAPFGKGTKPPSQLPPARLPSDAVVVDIAFVKLPTVDLDTYNKIWATADEQAIGASIRRELAVNGLRAGVYGQQFPAQLRELLDAPATTIDNLTDGTLADVSLGGARQHMPLRPGHRSIIKASAVQPSLAVLIGEGGTVRGHQLADACCIFSLKGYPQGDGRLKLDLTPEIEHGETKSRWVGTEGMMIPLSGQERLVLDRLRFECLLSPGQSLIVSTTPEVKGLGEHFFAQTLAGAVQRRALVIRYSVTQYDDLLAPEQTSARLATPGEQ